MRTMQMQQRNATKIYEVPKQIMMVILAAGK